jgi:hypothetical protein
LPGEAGAGEVVETAEVAGTMRALLPRALKLAFPIEAAVERREIDAGVASLPNAATIWRTTSV